MTINPVLIPCFLTLFLWLVCWAFDERSDARPDQCGVIWFVGTGITWFGFFALYYLCT